MRSILHEIPQVIVQSIEDTKKEVEVFEIDFNRICSEMQDIYFMLADDIKSKKTTAPAPIKTLTNVASTLVTLSQNNARSKDMEILKARIDELADAVESDN